LTSVQIPAGEDKTLIFKAGSDNGVNPGKYRFRIDGETHGGKINLTEYIAVKGNLFSTAVPGEYPVNIKVTANGSKEKSQFKIILTGTHESKVGTISSMVKIN
jgi:uncharacterized membrane protein